MKGYITEQEQYALAAVLQDVVHYFGSVAQSLGADVPCNYLAFESECTTMRKRLACYESGLQRWMEARDLARSFSLLSVDDEDPYTSDADEIGNDEDLKVQATLGLRRALIWSGKLGIEAFTAEVVS